MKGILRGFLVGSVVGFFKFQFFTKIQVTALLHVASVVSKITFAFIMVKSVMKGRDDICAFCYISVVN